jgi:hypothetical protein
MAGIDYAHDLGQQRAREYTAKFQKTFFSNIMGCWLFPGDYTPDRRNLKTFGCKAWAHVPQKHVRSQDFQVYRGLHESLATAPVFPLRIYTILEAQESPFSHACNNGANKKREGDTFGCINGLDHGRFATRDKNESHKGCRNGCMKLYPGHGAEGDLTHCIFTHKDTRLPIPCRNLVDMVPVRRFVFGGDASVCVKETK